MRRFSASALVVFSIFLCPSALAATVKPVQGEVLVNRGNGYEYVRGTSQASVGDIVMARPGGSAQVVYNDKCSVTVRPGQVVTIASEPPCNKTVSFDPNGRRMNVGVGHGNGFYELPPHPRHHWAPLVIVGGIAIAAGFCIAEEGICDNKPASP